MYIHINDFIFIILTAMWYDVGSPDKVGLKDIIANIHRVSNRRKETFAKLLSKIQIALIPIQILYLSIFCVTFMTKSSQIKTDMSINKA